jgi:hypothetical protein
MNEEDLNLTEGAEHAAEVAGMGGEIAGAAGVISAGAAEAVAPVAAAGVAGVWAGEEIEQHTHIGTDAGDAVFNASNPDDAHAAAVSFDDASDSWNAGHPLDAAENAAEGVGHMIEGLWDGNSDSQSE